LLRKKEILSWTLVAAFICILITGLTGFVKEQPVDPDSGLAIENELERIAPELQAEDIQVWVNDSKCAGYKSPGGHIKEI
jgi:hypothetical protein